MGKLSDDMARLACEIREGSKARQRVMQDLTQSAVDRARGVTLMRRGFSDDLAGARQAWRGPSARELARERKAQQAGVEERARREASLDAERRAKVDAEAQAKALADARRNAALHRALAGPARRRAR